MKHYVIWSKLDGGYASGSEFNVHLENANVYRNSGAQAYVRSMDKMWFKYEVDGFENRAYTLDDFEIRQVKLTIII